VQYAKDFNLKNVEHKMLEQFQPKVEIVEIFNTFK